MSLSCIFILCISSYIFPCTKPGENLAIVMTNVRSIINPLISGYTEPIPAITHLKDRAPLDDEVKNISQKQSLPLIKVLSETFKKSNETIGLLIETDKSNQIMRNQLFLACVFRDAAKNSLSDHLNPKNEKLISDGSMDFNFTYGNDARTQYMIAARSSAILSANGPIYSMVVMKWLKEHGAQTNILDNTGRDAALWSIGSFPGENPHPINLFFDQKEFDINKVYNVQDIGDELIQVYLPTTTLLMEAICVAWKEIYQNETAQLVLVKLLLEHGADADKEVAGVTPLQLAKGYKNLTYNEAVVRLLQKHSK